MREKLQTLPLSELKEMAKSRGIKGISSLRKAEIIDLLCDEAEKNPEIKPAEIKREVKTPGDIPEPGNAPESGDIPEPGNAPQPGDIPEPGNAPQPGNIPSPGPDPCL